MQTKKSLTTQATELGTKAFNDGKMCIPVQDKTLMDLIKNNRNQIGTKVGSSTFMFKAWSDAWIKSHNEKTRSVMMDIEMDRPITSKLPIALVSRQ